ncbi:hypothetical protein BTO20_37550 (plasmid) [Mycobacterium dioxanotrophicus]|jgi:hypothetical protein|uniref:Uncharacterized protein n=1 Tax=Mycobacterium dioxanotrophicus TaxID=482462 RepID=A0A1Y0CGD6_9MYCO|nr:hypothetical protein [Mycobacterium dioxanotrophicus]ART74331.1 hypothetical protein BTO20_37550 [Mycobacterium dioxanotrophicus]
MSIHAAIITTDCIATIAEPLDCLLDAMLDAQNRVGQITWTTIAFDSAYGTYRDSADHEAPITVVDTSATNELHELVRTWVHP